MDNKSLGNNHMATVSQKNAGTRSIEISISKDGIQAFITISYYNLPIDDAEKLPLYTISEIKTALSEKKITYGIIEENIKKCSESREIKNLIIAKGIEPEDDIEDKIEIKFKSGNDSQALEEDEHGRVDYKKIGTVNSVNKGDIIAIKTIGELGHDGVDVYGNEKKGKKKKKVLLRAGEGCIVKEENVIEALIDGMPCIKSNSFYVYPLHTINKDISLETGDIKFIGDIKIHGTVKEGMSVEAGNSLTIEGNTENATIWAKNDVIIKGNAVMTSITAGGKDVAASRYIGVLEEMKNLLNTMIETIEGIKKGKLLGDKISDGEMIKVLIENKFKDVPKLCWTIIRETYEFKKDENDELMDIIKSRLIGNAILKIKGYGELSDIISIMDKRTEELEAKLNLPATINVNYCQDCKVWSSGNIYVTGVGQYVSDLTANKGIYFTKDGSVARGGVLQANDEVNCKIVGSQGGVKTKIVVGKKGHINIGTAYQNTMIVVGQKEYIFHLPSYNIHAYINDNYELAVDKLTL